MDTGVIGYSDTTSTSNKSFQDDKPLDKNFKLFLDLKGIFICRKFCTY